MTNLGRIIISVDLEDTNELQNQGPAETTRSNCNIPENTIPVYSIRLAENLICDYDLMSKLIGIGKNPKKPNCKMWYFSNCPEVKEIVDTWIKDSKESKKKQSEIVADIDKVLNKTEIITNE